MSLEPKSAMEEAFTKAVTKKLVEEHKVKAPPKIDPNHKRRWPLLSLKSRNAN